MDLIAFYIFAGVAVLASLGVVAQRNPMHSVLLLIVSFGGLAALRFAPVVHTDNKASGRYTILDIVTGNALGLLYRISRVISQHGCDVDLVLIATEGDKAIDVFHITKVGSKLTEAEQIALTSDLQRTLEGTV